MYGVCLELHIFFFLSSVSTCLKVFFVMLWQLMTDFTLVESDTSVLSGYCCTFSKYQLVGAKTILPDCLICMEANSLSIISMVRCPLSFFSSLTLNYLSTISILPEQSRMLPHSSRTSLPMRQVMFASTTDILISSLTLSPTLMGRIAAFSEM